MDNSWTPTLKDTTYACVVEGLGISSFRCSNGLFPCLYILPYQRKAAGASSSSKNGTGGTAGTVGTSNTADTSTMGGSGHVGGDEQEDGEEDDMDFPDSGDEEESEEIVLMREEVCTSLAVPTWNTSGVRRRDLGQ